MFAYQVKYCKLQTKDTFQKNSYSLFLQHLSNTPHLPTSFPVGNKNKKVHATHDEEFKMATETEYFTVIDADRKHKQRVKENQA